MAHQYWNAGRATHSKTPTRHPSFTTTSTPNMISPHETSQQPPEGLGQSPECSRDGEHDPSPALPRPPPLPLQPDPISYPHPQVYGFYGGPPTSYLPYMPATAPGYYTLGPVQGSTYIHAPHFVHPPHTAPLPGHSAPSITPSLVSMPSTTSMSSLASVSSSPDLDSTNVPQSAPPPTAAQRIASGRTNWEPVTDGHGDDFEAPASASMVSSTSLVHSTGGEPHQPMVGRSRRAAASKARSNIASIVTNLRSPALNARPLDRPSTMLSGPASTNPSLRSGTTSTASPALSALSLQPTKHRASDPSSKNSLRVPMKIHPKQPAILLELKNHRGVLLEAPPGAHLEVNDLLILHPPTLSPNAKVKPVNQYNQPPGIISDGMPIEGYRSMFEMYTCRVCSKTYDGRNARSVARRHLQDKHGVKLALQKRRTRWDLEPDRPRTAVDAREKTLKSKRDWATRARQIQRLEKMHAKFLERYGPAGIRTPCNTRLTAPSMRGTLSTAVRNKAYPDGRLDWDRIPKALRDSLVNLVGIEAPKVEVEYEDADGEGCEEGQSFAGGQAEHIEPVVSPPEQTTRKGRLKRRNQVRPSATRSATITSADQVHEGRQVTPIRSVVPSGPSLQRTPISSSRLTAHEQGDEAEEESWATTWGSATRVDYQTLQTALAGLDEDETITDGQYAIALAPVSPGSSARHDKSISPEPVPRMTEIPRPIWVSPEEAIEALHANEMWYPRAQTYDYSFSAGAPADKPWLFVPSPDIPRVNTPSHNSLGGDVVAAESLLNLHSTPARPEDGESQIPTSSSDARVTAQGSTPYDSSQAASSVIRGLLDAPDITPHPRPQPHRTRSLIQPFNKSRPDSMTRSLSFSQQVLDDPFAISPNTTALLKAADESLNGKRRREAVGASPSPLTKRKKDEHRFDQLGRFESPRQPMSALRPNLHSVRTGTRSTSGADSKMNTMGTMSSAGLGFGAYASMGASGGTELKTPVRGKVNHVPSSLNKMWQFSSPSDPGAAASLGLVPSWGIMPGDSTPGMSGMVASETPVRHGRQ